MSTKEGTYLSDMRKRHPLASGWFSEVLASGLMSAADTASCVKSAILNLPLVLWDQTIPPGSLGHLPLAGSAITQLSLHIHA